MIHSTALRILTLLAGLLALSHATRAVAMPPADSLDATRAVVTDTLFLRGSRRARICQPELRMDPVLLNKRGELVVPAPEGEELDLVGGILPDLLLESRHMLSAPIVNAVIVHGMRRPMPCNWPSSVFFDAT